MGFVGTLHLRNTHTNHCATLDHLRLTLCRLGPLVGPQDFFKIMPIDFLNIPAVGTISGGNILALANGKHGVEGHVVVVMEKNKVVETEMTCKRGSLSRNPLLEAAVSGKNNDVVVKNGMIRRVEVCGSHFLGHGETNGIGNPLT